MTVAKGVDVEVAVAETVGVTVAVAVYVGKGATVAVGVAVCKGVPVAVGVGLAVGVGAGTAVDVGVTGKAGTTTPVGIPAGAAVGVKSTAPAASLTGVSEGLDWSETTALVGLVEVASGVDVNTGKAVGPNSIAGAAAAGVGDSFSESAEIFPFCVELAASKAVPAEIGAATALASCGVAVAACNSLTNMFAAVAAIIGFALSGGALTVTGIVAAGTDVIVTTASASPP